MITGKRRAPEVGEGEEYELAPSGPPLYELSDPEQRKIVGWKVDCFQRLGFGPTAASALAIRRDIGRGQVERMRTNGATCMQVVTILL